MKKRARIAILVVAAVVIASGAGLAWLGFLPFGRPNNEHDFMAQQLRRVRYAGPLRADEDRALADLLPPDPTVDDMRVAYWTRWATLDKDLRRGWVDARREEGVKLPSRDDAARKALDAVNARSAEIERASSLDGWMQNDVAGWDAGQCATFVGASGDVPDKLGSAVPVSGRVLMAVGVDGELDLPNDFGATVRVMAVRVRCHFFAGETDRGWQELLKLAAFCRDAIYGQSLFGLMCYDLKNVVFLSMCVLPLARQGQLSSEQLNALAERHRLPLPDPIEIAKVEQFMWLHQADNPETPYALTVAKAVTEGAFERHGATSLSDWLEQEIDSTRLRQEGWSTRLQYIGARGGRFRDPEQARGLLDTSDRDKGYWVLDQTKVLATGAACLAESEGLLLAVKLHAAKARDPAGWLAKASATAKDFPFAAIQPSGDSIEVRINAAHPVMAYLKESDRVLATVR